MEIDNLPEKVKKAKDAVADLDEPLKTEAFKKILDKLLEPDIQQVQPDHSVHTSVNRSQTKAGKNKSSKKRKLNQSNAKLKEEVEKKKRELADKVNRAEHFEIHDLKKTLAKALYVLKIMRDKEVDGLTPPEISYILKEVFKIKVSGESVSINLNRREAQRFVDRNRTIVGKAVAYVYKLMKGGEDYLEEELRKNKDHVNKTDEKLEPA